MTTVSAFGDELLDNEPTAMPSPAAPQAPAPAKALSAFGDELIDDEPDQLPSRTAGQWITDVGGSVGRGAYNLFDSLAGLGDIVTGGAATPWLAQHGLDSKQARAVLDAEMSPQARAQRDEVANAKGFLPTAKAIAQNPAYAAGQVIESVPSMVAGGVAGKGIGLGARMLGAGAPAAGLIGTGAGEGLFAAGQQAAQTVQQTGDLTPGQTGLALLSGGLTGLLGAAGARVGKSLGVQDIDALIASPAGVDVAKGLVNRVLTGSGIESLEELSQSAQQQVLSNIAVGKPPMEGIGNAAGQGAVLGGVMGGGASLRRPNMTTPQPMPMAPQQEQLQQAQPMPGHVALQPEPVHQQLNTAISGVIDAAGRNVERGQQALEQFQAQRNYQPLPKPEPTPFGGSSNVRPLFESMGMDQAQMDQSLALLADDEPDIQAGRRDKISWEETGRLAALTGVTTEKLRKHRVGVAFNAEEQVAATRLLRGQTLKTLELGNRISTGAATEIDQANFLQSLSDLRTTQKAVMSSRAEIGRAMAVMRADVTSMKEASRMLESVGGAQGAKAIADALTNATRVGGVEAANKLARQAGSDGFWTAYKSLLLSSPDTHIVNMVSNLATSVMNLGTRTLAGGIGAAKRLATGGKYGETRLGEPAYQVAGMLEGAVNGAKGAVSSWRTGEDAFGGNKAEIYRTDYPGQQVWGVPLRLLQSEDAFFKNLNDGMERYSVAYRMAANEGVKGPAAMHKRVQELIANPPKELVEAGQDAALFHTFNNNAGKITQAVNNLRHSLPMGTGNLIVPFLKTPANLMVYAAKHSIAAPFFKEVRADIRAGGAKQEEALARMGIGSLLTALGAVGAMNGSLTGGGPEDPEKRKAWLAAGNQPYSLKANGQWYQYSRVEPMATLVGIAADIATGKQEQALGMASMFKAMGRNFLSKTWLQGLSGAMQAMTDPDRYGGSWINRSAATLTQPATLLSHIGRYQDPYQRTTDRDSYVDQLKYRLPGETFGRESLPIKLDAFGDPIMEAQRQFGRAGPVPIATPSDDPVRREAARIGWSPSEFQKSITLKGKQLPLSDEQHYELAQLAGQLTHRGALRLMQSSAWKHLDDDVRKDALDTVAKRARAAVRLAALRLLTRGDRDALDRLKATVQGAK